MTTLLLLLATIGQCQGGRCPAPARIYVQQIPVYVAAPTYQPVPTPAPATRPAMTPPREPAQAMKARDAEAIREAKARLVAAGYTVSDGAPADPRHIADYDPVTRSIRIDVWAAYWEDRARNAAINHKLGFNSTGHPDHVLRHEMGHAELHRAIGDEGWNALRVSPLPLPAGRIRAVVSTYAANCTIDFHAEVFAGLKDGRTFPADVMDAYAKLMRP